MLLNPWEKQIPLEAEISLDDSDAKVIFRWIEPTSIQWHQYKKSFIAAFSDAFKDFSASDLDYKTTSKEQGLLDDYNDEIAYESKFSRTCNDNNQRMYFLEVNLNQKIIGYAIFHWDIKLPNEVYLSSLCLDPKMHSKNIGTYMIHHIKEILPTATHFVATTMKDERNKANAFYKKHLQCEQCPLQIDDTITSPEKFVSYKGVLMDKLSLQKFLNQQKILTPIKEEKNTPS